MRFNLPDFSAVDRASFRNETFSDLDMHDGF